MEGKRFLFFGTLKRKLGRGKVSTKREATKAVSAAQAKRFLHIRNPGYKVTRIRKE